MKKHRKKYIQKLRRRFRRSHKWDHYVVHSVKTYTGVSVPPTKQGKKQGAPGSVPGVCCVQHSICYHKKEKKKKFLFGARYSK